MIRVQLPYLAVAAAASTSCGRANSAAIFHCPCSFFHTRKTDEVVTLDEEAAALVPDNGAREVGGPQNVVSGACDGLASVVARNQIPNRALIRRWRLRGGGDPSRGEHGRRRNCAKGERHDPPFRNAKLWHGASSIGVRTLPLTTAAEMG
jgi:hypothetical protein